MARATTRSQPQKRRVQDSDDEQDRNMDVDGDDDDDSRKELNRAAYALVRLAVFNEHRRVPLRRDEISKKALGSNTRAFARVFPVAQEILRDTLGMELVELRSRAELDKDLGQSNANNNDDLEDARKATGVKQKSTAAGSKTYILRSTLNDRLIARASLTDEAILEDEAADAPSDDDSDDEYGFRNAPAGSIISWNSADQTGPLGVLYVILALILVSGRVMGDHDLRATLKRLHLPATGTITFSPASTHRTLTLDAYLTLLLRQGFLDRQQVGADAAKKGGKGKGAKRGRVTQADDEGGLTFEWRWGARAQSEVGERAIAEFVAEFMVGDEAEAEDEHEEGGTAAGKARAAKHRKDAESKLQKMLKGIERAAGGNLAEIM